jgi:hypothetical protein
MLSLSLQVYLVEQGGSLQWTSSLTGWRELIPVSPSVAQEGCWFAVAPCGVVKHYKPVQQNHGACSIYGSFGNWTLWLR